MFQGFSEKSIDFLWGIRLNNHRDWFLEHKQDYLDYVYQPLKELGQELEDAITELYPEEGLELKVTRIYRDARRVKYGGLYKDHLWLIIRRPSEAWTTRPAFYFQISPEGYEYGMGYYAMRPVMMEQYRRRIQREPEVLEKLARKLNRQERFHLEGEEYKRPKGECSELLKPWFNRKGIDLCAFHEPDEKMLSADLKDVILDGFKWLMPYYEYFKALELEPPVTEAIR
jgi:uncharacterized protein (TIGR02453 family)